MGFSNGQGQPLLLIFRYYAYCFLTQGQSVSKTLQRKTRLSVSSKGLPESASSAGIISLMPVLALKTRWGKTHRSTTVLIVVDITKFKTNYFFKLT